ncbi:Linear gramicidin synthase subunit D [Cytospora mali]|uniref:Linear gramicidin synthase subunit D n=1 Tax=Cytospora mali TaxID=578113 RepID=A0A194VJ23_CYTMA|nr:Linear gramicidin synthase subunit D [Valsa mali]
MATPYGSRLLPTVVDETAASQPGLTYAYVPISNRLSDGFKAITFSDVATATNYMAAWIHQNLGPSTSFQTIAYMGPGDLRYVVMFLAAVKCGYKVDALVSPLVEHKPDLHLHKIEALNDMIKADTQHYPYDKHYDAVRWDPILILPSSGSTGPPKPIVMNHATFAVGDNDRNLPRIPGRVNQNWSLWNFPQEETFFSPFPAFHLAGFSSMVLLPIYYQNAKLVMSPPGRPPTGHLVSEIMDHFKLKSIFCPPIVAEQLVQEPDGIDKCRSLKFLLYAGGPLSQNAGEALSKVTDVCQFYGQTETGAIQALVPRREDWDSLEWNPIQEVIMDPYDKDVYEMTMRKNPSLEKVRSLSANFPDVEVWHTKDLFRRHPTKPALWKFHGRVDDIVVLSTGEKFNPVPIEVQISAHPLVNGALIVGQGHPQPCLILEPKDAHQTLETLTEAVWPTIEKANSQSPGQARVTRDMILISSPSRPFQRSSKGTVVRTATGDQYKDEITELYDREISRNPDQIILGSPADQVEATKFVSDVVASASPAHDAQPSDDLFVLGLDSLQIIEIIKLLKAGIRSGDPAADISWISMRYIYEHPSIAEISHAVTLAHSNRGRTLRPLSDGGTSQNRVQKMEALLKKYTSDLPSPIKRTGEQPDPAPKIHVILTGSTGSLGIQLLLRLLSDPKVARISCLDRSANAKERIENALSTWSPPPSIASSRVSFHQADYRARDFQLPSAILSDLSETANIIIHNAWKVDFNHSLDTFEEVHIRGVRNLIDFSASSPLNPRIVFVSSISSVGGWHAVDPQIAAIPESLPPTLAAAHPTGYSDSKAVAEHILADAAKKSGLEVSILRVGQIAGPAAPGNGAKWNETEWFPLMIKTVKTTGKIPDGNALGDVDWIPVDLLSSIIWELSPVPQRAADKGYDIGSLQVFHLVNPQVRPWGEMLHVIKDGLGGVGPWEELNIKDWTLELENTDLNNKDAVASRPAVKILQFFRDVRDRQGVTITKGAVFSTDRAKGSSKTILRLGPVQDEWLLRPASSRAVPYTDALSSDSPAYSRAAVMRASAVSRVGIVVPLSLAMEMACRASLDASAAAKPGGVPRGGAHEPVVIRLE